MENEQKEFELTAKQKEALDKASSEAVHVMFFGGSRSGKTFLHVRNIVLRGLKAPGSRHLIVRFRFNHIKSSIIFGTFPDVMKKAFPKVPWKLNKSDWYVIINPGTKQEFEIWFGGLDDKERTEKILGNEYATIYLNECSQIPVGSRNIVVTRLAQLVKCLIKGREDTYLKPRMFYDCNPPSKAHWTYLLFVKKVDPETKKPLPDPHNYVSFQMNPQDNTENLAAGYLDTLMGMSARMQKRFLKGEFADATPNALFPDEVIDQWRHLDGQLPDFVRVAVGVDPSGSGDEDNADNDAIGIVVAALGTDGNCYVLEDCTVKAGPGTWGKVATSAFERHSADIVVGEVNFGGAMVKHTIQVARPRTPFLSVTASRGKVARAEPISALYEAGKVRHVGYFSELEEELSAFSTVGFLGDISPNRADALIWVLSALFPAILNSNSKKKSQPARPVPTLNHFGKR